MANLFLPILPIAREGDDCAYLGAVGGAMRGSRRAGDIWIVVHRGAPDGVWTHVYRSDPRRERTFHLERAVPGDARSSLIAWALSAFAIEAEAVEAA